ncbi:restriction endonuclease subunit S [Coraliomargarita sinensis]|uniref:restriction endonuclease subunit S n=1 Tax=Coraliomargarita sinensis TaxID=2174842 RepID=UPI001E5194FA|nr:restriction endonuclease subunit S [Coraliomargarita sinensis]
MKGDVMGLNGFQKYEFQSLCSLSKKKYNPNNSLERYQCYELEHLSQETGRIIGSVDSKEQSSIKNVFSDQDVLFGKLRPYLKKYALPSTDGVCSTEIWVLVPKTEVCSRRYLFALIQSEKFVRCASIASGSKMPRADWNYISTQVFEVPQILEQEMIADILGACDEAIEAQERLITQKQERQKGLMQKLLVGEVRFPKFDRTPWEELKLGSVLKHVFRPISWSPEMSLKLVSIRRRAGGLFLRPEMKGSDYKTSDLHEIRKGDFLISKRQVTHGALAVVKTPFDGCHVSKEYTIFENTAPKVLHTPYLDWLSKTREMWHKAYVASNGVAIEKLIFVPKDFLKFEIKLPPTIEEQRRIASFLNEQEQEIVLSRKRLEVLKLQKKSLMQKLLTGEVRVKV